MIVSNSHPDINNIQVIWSQCIRLSDLTAESVQPEPKHATSGMYGVDVQRKVSVWQHEVRGSEFLGQPMPGYPKQRLAWTGNKDTTSDKQDINISPDAYDGVK